MDYCRPFGVHRFGRVVIRCQMAVGDRDLNGSRVLDCKNIDWQIEISLCQTAQQSQ